MSEREPIGVVGVGWVGLVTAACFAEMGHRVVARDILPEKVTSLRAGELPFHEPNLAELIEKNAERLTFTTEMADLLDEARLIFVTGDVVGIDAERFLEESGCRWLAKPFRLGDLLRAARDVLA